MAHRGNQIACPENTLAAFRQALADGADILETDLHLSADGVFVCIHDSSVDRTTDGSGEVSEMPLAAIKELSASYGRPEFAAERVPTLAELAAIVPADVALALELKTDRLLEEAVCENLANELAELGVRARSVLLSFSLDRLQAMEAVAQDIPRGWITLERPWPLQGVQLLGPFWPLLLLNPLYVWLAHRSGQLVAPLDPTPDSRLGLYRLLGCDAILTDNPEATCRALGRPTRTPGGPQTVSAFGVVLFNSTNWALRAERESNRAGLDIMLVPTPRHLSSDCGTALRFKWPDREALVELLQERGVEFHGISPLWHERLKSCDPEVLVPNDWELQKSECTSKARSPGEASRDGRR
jgi:glycerophosphoryl diester phosphodiesterase